jgi:hypothetical protein
MWWGYPDFLAMWKSNWDDDVATDGEFVAMDEGFI